MKMSLVCLTMVGASAVSPAEAACYTVYGRTDMLFQSTKTPVDLSGSLSETVTARFGPGAIMVVSVNDTECPEVGGPGTFSAGGKSAGAARVSTAPELSNTGASALPRRAGERAPANLDHVFVNQGAQMRGSVGVPSGGSAGTVHIGPK